MTVNREGSPPPHVQGDPTAWNFPANITYDAPSFARTPHHPHVMTTRGGTGSHNDETVNSLLDSVQALALQVSEVYRRLPQDLATPAPVAHRQDPSSSSSSTVASQNPFDHYNIAHRSNSDVPSRPMFAPMTPMTAFAAPPTRSQHDEASTHHQSLDPSSNHRSAASVQNPFDFLFTVPGTGSVPSSARFDPYAPTVPPMGGTSDPDTIASDTISTTRHMSPPPQSIHAAYIQGTSNLSSSTTMDGQTGAVPKSPTYVSDRVPFTHKHLPSICPVTVPFKKRWQHSRYPGKNGWVTRWLLLIQESKTGSFDSYQICLTPGEYLFEDCGCPLIILGYKTGYGPIMFSFPIGDSTVWAAQQAHIPPTVLEAPTLKPVILPSVVSRGPRIGGLLHPACFGAPGNNQPCNYASHHPCYTPKCVFSDATQVVFTSYASAYCAARSAGFAAGQGGIDTVKSHSSEAAAAAYFSSVTPTTVSRPALVPYIALQLETLDLLEDRDGGLLPHNPKYRKNGEVFGKRTPMLYPYDGDAKTRDEWVPFPGLIQPDSSSSEDEDPSHGRSPPHDDSTVVSNVTTTDSNSSYSRSEERERSFYRLQNLVVPPMPLATEALREWNDNLGWVLASNLWEHDGIHVTDLLETTPETATLSRDFLMVLQKGCSAHKDKNERKNARNMLKETIGKVDGDALIKSGKGIELYQSRIFTCFHRGLGTEVITTVKDLTEAKQLSQESVGSFFARSEQLYNQVTLTKGCDMGDTARKALLVNGLEWGAYRDVFGPWSKKIMIRQGKNGFMETSIQELRREATDLLATSSFYRNNMLLPGKHTARSAVVSDDGPTTSTNVEAESIVSKLRAGQQLSRKQAAWMMNQFSCPVCFSHTHGLARCYAAATKFTVTEGANSAVQPPSQGGSGGDNGKSDPPKGRRSKKDKEKGKKESSTPPETETEVGRKANGPNDGAHDDSSSSDGESSADEDSVLFTPFGYDTDTDSELMVELEQKARRAPDNQISNPTLAQKVMARIGKKGGKLVQKNLKWDSNVDRDLAKLKSESYSYPRSNLKRYACTDSGATSTMCPFLDMFTNYEDLSSSGQVVRLGDESQTIPILGKGTMCLEMACKFIAYEDVLYVPALTSILLSTRVHRRITPGCSFIADYDGCHLTFPSFSISIDDSQDCVIPCSPIHKPSKCRFDFDSRLYNSTARLHKVDRARKALCRMHKSRLVQAGQTAPVSLDPHVFKQEKNFPSPPVYSVQNSGAAAIERISSYDMKKMFGSRVINDWRTLESVGTGVHVVHEGEPPLSLGDVSTILRNKHGKLLQRPSKALDTIGMDINYGAGTSPGGYKYALTIVDFATRHTWIYGIKSKSGANIIDALWSFFVDAGGLPRRIRCDFDSSFVKGKAYAFLRRKGIKVTASPPNRQSQNGAVERQWRTAVSMARALLVDARLPQRYWFWALREAAIRMNMLPCKPTKPLTEDQVSSESPDPACVAAAAYATARPATPHSALSTPFELFYGRKPDFRTLFHWGCLGFYRRDHDSSGGRGSYDMQSSVGIAIGRSNHTNGMIFWDPVTQRMNVSADYKLDATAAIGTYFPNVIYDGQISPQVLRGGKQSTKEPFPPNSQVQVRIDSDYFTGTVRSVPTEPEGIYHISFPDSSDIAEVPLSCLFAPDEPEFTLPTVDETFEEDEPEPMLPTLPDWIKTDTKVVLSTDGRRRRGTLQSTDKGWTFQQRTSSGRVTFTHDLADLPVTWRDRILEGTIELGWQKEERAYKVSARNLKQGPPPSFQASMKTDYPDHKIWNESFLEESGGLKEQDTYFCITPEEYKNKYSHVQIIPSMCVQTIKKDETGAPDRAKSRIVALGNHEEHVWEKSEKFAPVLRDESSRLMTSMAVERGRREKQGDCKNAFCQSYLPKNETIILRPPKGAPGTTPGELWVLRKTLYGLRRSPYHWYQNIKRILLGMKLTMSAHDPCVFFGALRPDLPPVYIGLYVDDFKYFSESDEAEKLFEDMLSSKCRVDFMGDVSWFLGCKYKWENLPDNRLTVSITQTAKAEELLETHGMTDCNPVDSPYRSGFVIDRIPHDGIPNEEKTELVKKYQGLVGGLLWLQRQTRPDISTAVSLLSSFSHKPSQGHYEAGKRVLRYLKGTLDRGIRFTEGGSVTTAYTSFPTDDGCYTDANWGPQDASHPKEGDTVSMDEVKSLLGHVVFRMGGPIIWGCTRELDSISCSSCESEIYATDEGTKSVLTLRNLLGDFGLPEAKTPTPVWNDNKGTVDWSKGVSVSKRLRHVNMRNLAVRLSQQLGDINVIHIEGKINIADLFTKEIKDSKHFIEMATTITTPRLLAAPAA